MGSTTNGSIGVVYLARSADGLEALCRFANSYGKHPSGLKHDLIIAYKGFKQRSELEAAYQRFLGLPHIGIELDDSGFDIGSYIEVCRRISYDYLFFLNTHSELVAPAWLSHVFNHAAHEGCGIAGTMGSYESLFDTVRFLESVVGSSLVASGELAKQLAYYFDFILPRFRPDWYRHQDGGASGMARLTLFFRRRSRQIAYKSLGGVRGTALVWPGTPDIDTSLFPPFPNPHMRTNGFMIRRTRLLSSKVRSMHSKMDANLFESGKEGLTTQLRRAGLATMVVGANGRGYDVEDWWRSDTFRLSGQADLLIADNHTRAFGAMSAGARVAHERMTWGDYLGPGPSDFPTLGCEFLKGSLAPCGRMNSK